MYCKQIWCPATLGQDWCPSRECSQGTKGNKFQPYDEHFEWVQCKMCQMWFKTLDIMAVHNCFNRANPKAIEGFDNDDNGDKHNDNVNFAINLKQETEETNPLDPLKEEQQPELETSTQAEDIVRPWTPEEARKAYAKFNKDNNVKYELI